MLTQQRKKGRRAQCFTPNELTANVPHKPQAEPIDTPYLECCSQCTASHRRYHRDRSIDTNASTSGASFARTPLTQCAAGQSTNPRTQPGRGLARHPSVRAQTGRSSSPCDRDARYACRRPMTLVLFLCRQMASAAKSAGACSVSAENCGHVSRIRAAPVIAAAGRPPPPPLPLIGSFKRPRSPAERHTLVSHSLSDTVTSSSSSSRPGFRITQPHPQCQQFRVEF